MIFHKSTTHHINFSLRIVLHVKVVKLTTWVGLNIKLMKLMSCTIISTRTDSTEALIKTPEYDAWKSLGATPFFGLRAVHLCSHTSCTMFLFTNKYHLVAFRVLIHHQLYHPRLEEALSTPLLSHCNFERLLILF